MVRVLAKQTNGNITRVLFFILGSFLLLRYNDRGGTITPKANHRHGKADGGKASLDGIRALQTLDVDAHVLAVDGLIHVLFAGGLAVYIAEDLVASLHARARRRRRRRRRLLGRRHGRSSGDGGRGEQARGGEAQPREQRGVEQVRVAGVARGEGVGERKGRGGERRQRDEGRLQRGGEVGEGVDGGGGRGELQERGEGEAGDGVGDALCMCVLAWGFWLALTAPPPVS